MMDIAGTALTETEREQLRHPLVGGLLLFGRNFESPQQLGELMAEVHGLRNPRLLVAVDHEGGRVQRFREGFTPLPPMAHLGALYDDNRKRAKRLAETCGWLLAAELGAVGIDLSFAPVLDLDRGLNTVIGDRAFHRNPDIVADLAHSVMNGMRRGGMAAVGKHFPGHGGVSADSHAELPVDERRFEDILTEDLVPFERLIHFGLPAIMPAHVLYPRVDREPAGYSRFWLQEVLRGRLGFQGVIFSDDLSMAGAHGAGDIVERARAALGAGCDMVLVCNEPAAVAELLERMPPREDPARGLRLVRLHGRGAAPWGSLQQQEAYRQARAMVLNLA